MTFYKGLLLMTIAAIINTLACAESKDYAQQPPYSTPEIEPYIDVTNGKKKVIIFIGQSNCASPYTSAITVPAHINVYDELPLAVGDWGIESAVAQDLDVAADAEWHLIKYARGGSLITDRGLGAPYWIGGPDGHLQLAIDAINTTLAGIANHEVLAVVWIQGESEALNNLGHHYYTDLKTLIDTVRLEWADVPFFITQLSALTLPDVNQVRSAQSQVNNEVLLTDLVSTQESWLQADGIHYSDTGIRDLGDALATIFNALIL